MKIGIKPHLSSMILRTWARGGELTSHVSVKRTLMFLFLFFRMGGKVLEEAVLSETRDKAEGGGMEELLDNIDNPSCIRKSWRKMHRSLNSIVGPSTMKSDGDKGIYPNCKILKRIKTFIFCCNYHHVNNTHTHTCMDLSWQTDITCQCKTH